MADERIATEDTEMEALLRRQPRRMPSPALWARLAAETAPAPRAGRRRAWAAAAAVVVAGTFALWLATRPAPRAERAGIGRVAPPRLQVRASAPQQVTVVEQASPSKAGPRRHVVRVVHSRDVPPKVQVTDVVKQAEPKPAPVGEKADESSYYLEVSHGGRSSVLSGSVTRDASDRVTRVSIAYDPDVETKSAN